MYINEGSIQGTLAKDPQKVAEGVVLLIVKVRDSRINPKTKTRDFHYPRFVIFGTEADKALKNLDRGQEVSLKYKLETRSKEIDGEKRYFEDKVVTRIQYGSKYEQRAKIYAANTADQTVKLEEVLEDN